MALILLVIGFAVGYLSSKGRRCQENPFVYGIKEVNELNNDNYYCECHSNKGYLSAFSFDDRGIDGGRYIQP